MEHSSKRVKTTKEAIIEDISATIEEIADSVKTIGECQRTLLRTNKIIVSYMQRLKEQKKEINISELGEDSE